MKFSENPLARKSVHNLNDNAWLAAVVDCSDDAILSKTLDGVILSWNAAAERLFGYTAQEVVGQHIKIIIPQDRWGEEDAILARLRDGEMIDHFETVRRRKDGEMIEISLTVSPVRDETGTIIGASKIARNISEIKDHVRRQHLLLREMNHRVKNLFALVSGLLALSARNARSAEELARGFSARIGALDRAHTLTMPSVAEEGREQGETSLAMLVAAVVAPYETENSRCALDIPGDIGIGPRSLPMLALVVHELATNSAKYGALSGEQGQLRVRAMADEETLLLQWEEDGYTVDLAAAADEGFGSQLLQTAARGLGGQFTRDWTSDGLKATLRAPRAIFSN